MVTTYCPTSERSGSIVDVSEVIPLPVVAVDGVILNDIDGVLVCYLESW